MSDIVLVDFRKEKKRQGHDCTWGSPTPGHLSVTGWCTPRPRQGNFLLLEEDGDLILYQVESVRYPGDPPDMFFAECAHQKWSTASEELKNAFFAIQ